MKAAQKAVATPMRTSARDLDACFFAYRWRSWGGGRRRSGAAQVRGGCMGSWHGVCMTSAWEVHGRCMGCAWVVQGSNRGLSAGAARGANWGRSKCRGRCCEWVRCVGTHGLAPASRALREAERHVVHLRGHRRVCRIRFPMLNRLSQRRLGLQRRLGWQRRVDWRLRAGSAV